MKTILLTLLFFLPFLCSAQPTTIKPTTRATGMALIDAETMMVLGDNLNPMGSMDVATNVILQKYNLTSGAKVWEKTITQSRGTYAEQQRIKQTKDGGYIISMRAYTFSGFSWESRLQLIRTNEEGNIIWNKTYDKEFLAYDVQEVKDAGFVITGTSGSNIFILKVDNLGGEQWRSLLSSTYGSSLFTSMQGNYVLETQDGNYLVVGKDRNGFINGTNRTNEDILIIKLNSEGKEVWRQNVDRGGTDNAWAAAEAPNGDFIVAGSTQDNPGTDIYTHKAFATRLSNTGDFIWSKILFGDTLTNEVKYLKVLANDSIIAVGNNYRYTDGTGANYCYKTTIDEQGNVSSEQTVLAKAQLFHYENTPLHEVLAGSYYQNEFWVSRGDGSNSGSCDIQTSISASGSLDLCPGETVTLSAEEGFASYKWSTGQTTRTITVTQGGEYKVEVTNEIGCPYATEPVTVTIKQPFNGEQLCYVTVDKATGKNKLLWTKTPDKNTAFFDIYKNDVNGYIKIGTVPFNDAPKFIDHTSQPNTKTDKYSIRAVDHCGNVSPLINAHRTVLLQSSLGTNGEVNLIWNKYDGVEVRKVTIFRGPHVDTLAAITELSGQEDRYIDRNPVKREHVYVLGVELITNCSAEDLNARLASASAVVFSNALSLKPSGLSDEIKESNKGLHIYPNPVKQEARITIAPKYAAPFTLQLYNATGKVVQRQIITTHESIVYRNNLPVGIYQALIQSRDGSYFMKKIIFAD